MLMSRPKRKDQKYPIRRGDRKPLAVNVLSLCSRENLQTDSIMALCNLEKQDVCSRLLLEAIQSEAMLLEQGNSPG